MNGQSRRKIEMGTRVLEFSRSHPDSEPGAADVVAGLEQLLARANQAAAAQREGIIRVHAASVRKAELRRRMLRVPIAHLAAVGQAAGREDHELAKTFRFRPSAGTYHAFQTAARSMAEAAEEHQEVLLKYGLSRSVLEEFVRMLDQFDAAMALGNEGRAAHVGATREIRVTSSEILRTVRRMDGRNRHRFAEDEQLQGSWISASAVRATPRPEAETPGGGEARPAA